MWTSLMVGSWPPYPNGLWIPIIASLISGFAKTFHCWYVLSGFQYKIRLISSKLVQVYDLCFAYLSETLRCRQSSASHSIIYWHHPNITYSWQISRGFSGIKLKVILACSLNFWIRTKNEEEGSVTTGVLDRDTMIDNRNV